MQTVSPKVSAAGGAAGGSMPLPIIIIWLLGLAHIDVPQDVAVAITALIATGAALITGYIVPHVPPPPPPPPPTTQPGASA